jgi:hypothetical protein
MGGTPLRPNIFSDARHAAAISNMRDLGWIEDPTKARCRTWRRMEFSSPDAATGSRTRPESQDKVISRGELF